MPRVHLIHGSEDQSVPAQAMLDFADALKGAAVAASCSLHQGKTHTSFLLEGPMTGGRDILADEILGIATGRPDAGVSHASMCPALLCRMAGYVCPF